MAGHARPSQQYSPTDSAPPSRGHRGKETCVDTEEAPLGELRDKRSAPCPVLCLGTKLDKAMVLKPDRWMIMGRDKHCHLLLDNASVSRNHCSLRWDPRTRQVELKDTSGTGTKVNGINLRHERQALSHGDRICVEGKAVRYEMLIDMRPVFLDLEDPRLVEATMKKVAPPPVQMFRRREMLRAELLEADKKLKGKEVLLFEYEKEYYDTQTRRRLREMSDQERTEELETTLKSKADLQQKLQETREAWAERMRSTMEDKIEEKGPLVKQAAEVQERLDKLMLKKAEVEKEIHPERLALLPDLYGSAVEGGAGSVRSGNLSSDDEAVRSQAGDGGGKLAVAEGTPGESQAGGGLGLLALANDEEDEAMLSLIGGGKGQQVEPADDEAEGRNDVDGGDQPAARDEHVSSPRTEAVDEPLVKKQRLDAGEDVF